MLLVFLVGSWTDAAVLFVGGEGVFVVYRANKRGPYARLVVPPLDPGDSRLVLLGVDLHSVGPSPSCEQQAGRTSGHPD